MSEILNVREVEQFLYSAYQAKKTEIKAKRSKSGSEKVSPNINSAKLYFLSFIMPFGLDSAIAKPSKIHGTGVFVKKNILVGELITFYPADFVEYSPDKNRHIPKHLVGVSRSARYVRSFGLITDSNVRDNNYACYIDPKYTIIGEKTFDNDPNYLGHLINDGAKSDSSKKSNRIYSTISSLKANCKYYNLKGGLHVAIIATKNIREGEELFITYGIPYWRSHNNKI